MLDPRAIASLADDVGVKQALQHVADQVAERAASTAPKDSGRGAESIHAVAEEDGDGAYVNVSWDRAHFYMYFHELGTSKLVARPFLRPALDAQYTI